jgi:hypothetical protein
MQDWKNRKNEKNPKIPEKIPEKSQFLGKKWGRFLLKNVNFWPKM